MKITITASGNPAKVNEDVRAQVKSLRTANEAAAPTLDSLRTYVSQKLAAADPESIVSLSINASVDVTITAPVKKK
jgi:hypothetical protein